MSEGVSSVKSKQFMFARASSRGQRSTGSPPGMANKLSTSSYCSAILPQPPCVENSNRHKPRCAVSKHRVVGERLGQLTCLAENEARIGLAAATARCCNESYGGGTKITSSKRYRAPLLMKWPIAYLQAVQAARLDERPIDFNFIGALGGDNLTLARRQCMPIWGRNHDGKEDESLICSSHVRAHIGTGVLEFARTRFTNASIFVDTTPGLTARTYQPRGPWDHTLRHRRFRPKDAVHSERGGCARSACDPHYLATLARSRYTLAPAGDQPWSHRHVPAG